MWRRVRTPLPGNQQRADGAGQLLREGEEGREVAGEVQQLRKSL